MPEAWIEIGHVRTVNPARRQLRVRPLPEWVHQFHGMSWIRLLLADDAVIRCRVETVRSLEKAEIVTLAPGMPRDAVARMKGAAVVATVDEAKPRPGASFAAHQFRGASVFDGNGICLGVVSDIIQTPAHDVIEVKSENGKTLLFPAVAQVFSKVDPQARALVISDVEKYGIADATVLP